MFTRGTTLIKGENAFHSNLDNEGMDIPPAPTTNLE